MADWSRLPEFVRAVGRRFRARRMRWFCDAFGIRPETLVLDVGGTGVIWEVAPTWPRLVIINRAPMTPGEAVRTVRADACQLPFRDKAFPVVFSNSVMEHVGDYVNQRRFAAEVGRVGRSYFVQTGNQRFPLDSTT